MASEAQPSDEVTSSRGQNSVPGHEGQSLENMTHGHGLISVVFTQGIAALQGTFDPGLST